MSKTKDAGQQMLSEADQAELLKLPLHTPKEIQSYLKPGEGFERVAPVALNLLGRHPEIAAALKIDLAALKDELGRAAHLASRAAIAKNLERRAEENRLEAESDVYRALLKVNRFVQNAEDADLEHEFTVLSEWVANTHGGGARTPAPPPAPAPTAAKTP